ncbi:MAG: DNA recombination protein RmuC [Clostridiales bacterium]|nr:DNA recombination protein RmuC [Clostridiales bacterium]
METIITIVMFTIAGLSLGTLIFLIVKSKREERADGEDADADAETEAEAERARAIAGFVVEKVVEELKAQRQEAQAEAREQRGEAAEMSQRQRAELAETLGKSNAQTAQLIQASSEGTQKSLAELQASIRDKVDERLEAIQKSNEQKLDEMRRTVDEKLETTLNIRLKNSFEIVNQQLESVNTRLGEMRSVAESVSNLNKALSGSKTRGILGELQLSQIIEDMLPPHLYEREAQVREGSAERVEFAIKLPGQDGEGFAYLPIDSKFPLDDYYRLVDGYEKGDAAAIDTYRKFLLAKIKESAKDVRKKYINPPRTTTFAVMFLPTEGLYAEAVRDATFFEDLRKLDIIIAGPTTLSALLSSLLVGFKTLQIQKGAVEIQNTLEKTKKEFSMFSDVLVNAQNRIRMTGEDLDKLVGTRTRKINAALKNVQVYTFQEGEEAFPELETDDDLV